MNCPCCGQPVSADDFLVDLDANVIVYRRKIVRVPGKAAEILSVLKEAYPKSVTHDRMVSRIYGLSEKDNAPLSLSTIISTLRAQLRAHKIPIELVKCTSPTGTRLRLL